ncbi:MAG: peptide chain release factor N(5)-glutamine methyltransferase [Desulfovibrionaceae bacterium]
MSLPLLRDVLRHAVARLTEAGVDSPRLSSRLLAGKALGLDQVHLITESDRPLTPEEMHSLEALILRRAAGEPVAYILGEKEFYGLSFQVSPAVLIPRPETEQIVELAEAHFISGEPFRFLDLGTGSGALAVTLATRFPKSRGMALDISAAALDVARENSRRHCVEDRVQFLLSDFCSTLPGAPVDLIVANPPYISPEEYAGLDREVADFEPRLALESGRRGLAHAAALAPRAAEALRAGGILLLEMGCTQGMDMQGIFSEPSLRFEEVRVLQDLAGLDRVLLARKSS